MTVTEDRPSTPETTGVGRVVRVTGRVHVGAHSSSVSAWNLTWSSPPSTRAPATR